MKLGTLNRPLTLSPKALALYEARINDGTDSYTL